MFITRANARIISRESLDAIRSIRPPDDSRDNVRSVLRRKYRVCVSRRVRSECVEREVDFLGFGVNPTDPTSGNETTSRRKIRTSLRRSYETRRAPPEPDGLLSIISSVASYCIIGLSDKR